MAMYWLLMASVALAHKPTFSDGAFSSQENAYEVADPDVSIVVYHAVTCDTPQLWMTLDTSVQAPTYLQLGVPVIDRLADYRPSVAMLAPGLPPLDRDAVPFEIPEGMGGVVFDTDEVDQPGDFFEPFTQTSSWILVETYVEVDTDGEAYIIAWDRGEQTGKLWVATGETEQFTSDDWSSFPVWLEKVQAFHETAGGDVLVETEEEDCSAPELTDETKRRSRADTRCSSLPGSATGGGVWLLVVAAIAGRRRRTSA